MPNIVIVAQDDAVFASSFVPEVNTTLISSRGYDGSPWQPQVILTGDGQMLNAPQTPLPEKITADLDAALVQYTNLTLLLSQAPVNENYDPTTASQFSAPIPGESVAERKARADEEGLTDEQREECGCGLCEEELALSAS